MNAEQYIDKLDSPLKEIVMELRKIVMNQSSDMKEEMKWNVPTYSIKKNIFSIMAHKEYVNFQIFRGNHIKSSQELEGTGKDMRHLRFSTIEGIEKTKLEKYLRQAIEIDE